MNLILDTSALNKLKNDPELAFLSAGIESGYFTRITAYNLDEIVATKTQSDRTALLDVCQSLVRNGECVHPSHSIIDVLVKDYEANGSSYWNGSIRVPGLERELHQREISNAVDAEQREFATKYQAQFEAVFSVGRTEFEELFANGTQRPSLDEFLAIAKGDGGILWNVAGRLYQHQAGYIPDELKVRRFLSECPPVNALAHAILIAQFERTIRDLSRGESYRAGRVDIFSAVYLPYCDVFVTDDERQARCMRAIASATKLAVEVSSFEEFRSKLYVRF